MIVHADAPVTLIGGGHLGTDDLATALTLAPRLVAADGGAAAALGQGHEPEAVIGDMDSLSPDLQARLRDRLHPIAEQETTDFDKCLRSVAAPLIIAVGFTGGRLDHALAVLHSLVRHPHRPCLVLGPQDIVCLCPPQVQLDLTPDTPLSLFPLGLTSVRSSGLVWPTDDLTFAPDRRIGTSNTATGAVTLQAAGPAMLIILPRAALTLAVAALLAAPRWPRPAVPAQ
jgi:thiamine pyrophosphokinase